MLVPTAAAPQPATEPSRTHPKKDLTRLQTAGVLALLVCYALALFLHGTLGTIFAIVCFGGVYIACIASYLWRYRHVLHFWWSLLFACVVHACCMPVYISLTVALRHAHYRQGRYLQYIGIGILMVEGVGVISVIRWIAMRVYKRKHPAWPHKAR